MAGIGRVQDRANSQRDLYRYETTVDTLADDNSERNAYVESCASSVDWNSAPFELRQSWVRMMLDIDPKSRGRVPVREFTDRWKHLVDQMERDFLVKLLKLLHRNGETRDRKEILDEASAKFSRVFHSKMYLPNLSVRLDAVRDQLMVDQQRVCHIRPTEALVVLNTYHLPTSGSK